MRRTGSRVLFATRDLALFFRIRKAMQDSDKEIVGVVDPFLPAAFKLWQEEADIVVIGVRDLAQFHRQRQRPLAECTTRLRLLVALRDEEMSEILQIIEALGLTASVGGYVLIDREDCKIVAGFELAVVGYTAIPRATLPRLRSGLSQRSLLDRLTAEEKQLLQLIGQGLINAAIAEQLGLPEQRVKTRVRALLTKLRFANRTAAAVFAHRSGLLCDGSSAVLADRHFLASRQNGGSRFRH